MKDRLNRVLQNKKLRYFLLALVVVYVACYYFIPSYSVNYKVTVSVETPEGVKTGSAVRQISNDAINELPIIDQISINPARVKGEAVVIDLGDRGILFALLSTDEESTFYKAFPVPSGRGAATREGIRYYRSIEGNEDLQTVLKKRYWPQFVMFEDMNDPKMVKQVLPTSSIRRDDPYQNARVSISKAFGQGVSIKSVTIEMTDEDVTTGVVEYLPWLPEYQGKMFDGRRYNTLKSKFPVANSLSSGSFSTEVE